MGRGQSEDCNNAVSTRSDSSQLSDYQLQFVKQVQTMRTRQKEAGVSDEQLAQIAREVAELEFNEFSLKGDAGEKESYVAGILDEGPEGQCEYLISLLGLDDALAEFDALPV